MLPVSTVVVDHRFGWELGEQIDVHHVGCGGVDVLESIGGVCNGSVNKG
jgi:hypothetical protein